MISPHQQKEWNLHGGHYCWQKAIQSPDTITIGQSKQSTKSSQKTMNNLIHDRSVSCLPCFEIYFEICVWGPGQMYSISSLLWPACPHRHWPDCLWVSCLGEFKSYSVCGICIVTQSPSPGHIRRTDSLLIGQQYTFIRTDSLLIG